MALEGTSAPRTLYNLDKLIARPEATVIICEGAKCADAASRIFPEMVAIASLNGAKSAKQNDWTVLAGRMVIQWPDVGEAGAKYVDEVAAILATLLGTQIRRIDAAALAAIDPAHLLNGAASRDPPAKFDSAFAIEEGWGPERLRELALEHAKPIDLAALCGGAILEARKDAASDDSPCVRGERFTDLGNARRFVRFSGADIRYVAHFNAWYIWEGHRWRRDEDGAIMRLAKSAVEKLFDEAAKIEDETLRTAMRKFALASQSCARLAAMVKLAESELPVVLSHKLLDADPMLLGVKNGVIELETGTFREGRREDNISKQCDVAYDPRATCPEWRKFQVTITSSDADLIAYKQRLAGVLLTGMLIEILFIPWGCGSNGKSTELETYQAILGEYGHATDASLLLARKETTGPTPEIVALKGKRAVFINETPERARLNEARVKYLTGNDTLYGRGLHQEPINFQPTHKVLSGHRSGYMAPHSSHPLHGDDHRRGA